MKAFLTAALAAILFAGHAQSSELPRTLRVGSDITSPPYIYFDDNKLPAGFDAEFMSLLGKAGNFKIEFLDTRFENLILGIGADKFDVIASSMFIKPERAKQIDFIPYGNAGLGFASLATSDFKPENAAALCGKKIAIIKGAAYIDMIRNLCSENGNSVDIREFPSSAEASQAVLSGNVDAQADDAAVLKVAEDKTGGRLVITTKEVLYPVVLGIGVSKSHPEMKTTLEAAFDQIKADGTYQKLLTAYNISAPTEAQYKAAIGQ
ncbi:ABC transporter substrate-binding protein [Phyllobacterium sp. UNC302MFCol5.2]|uniref:ABC transporter substrate-binding protein n=1 Tax=Phyllobacterium sp. UNC302MFCol5.2 TaxID=1449065 RepID=UPI0018CC4DDA|nr:ABC transporter substrate-binding protein [Phyllobacterium sp. UNC302MFCol5.2]